ncbi:MAG: aldo/keto reductase [Candidatus Thermoplasmatota archaeon]|nr:aldo/keto reductase [Candidatus Thermoplasmatota archaeon]
MEYRLLGRSGVKVSELCLGTLTFGWKVDEAHAHEILDAFTGNGGNFLDTANVYNGGKSEEIVGSWLKGREREEVVVATKVRFRTAEHQNAVGLSRKHIISSVNESLERLQTDYIDLLQVHAWDPLTPVEETLRTLNDLVRSGKVRYIGASNFRAWQLASFIEYSRHHDLEEFISLQPQYNLLTRATEYELVPYCRRERIGILPWSPLKAGILSGRYTREMGEPPEGSRLRRRFERGMRWPWNDEGEYVWRVVDLLKSMSGSIGKTPSQIALNWLLRNPAVTAPIIGVSSGEQLSEDLGSTGWKLSDQQMRELDDASTIFVTYPYDRDTDNQQVRGRESN